MVDQGFKVIDFHCHFPVATNWGGMGGGRGSRGRPESAITGGGAYKASEQSQKAVRDYAVSLRAEWRLAHCFEAPDTEERTEREQADRWAAEIDKYGLERAVFVTGGGNDKLAEIVSWYPDKFIGFAHHNPFADDAADELRRAVREKGLKGYKLIAPALDRPIDDPSGYPTWEAAEELGIPILVHFGVLGGGGGISHHVNMSPLMLHNVARDFATIPFVIPHLGCGYVRELLHLMWSCGNVHVDTSGSNQWMRWMPEELTTKILIRKYVETAGAERVVYGSDSSWFPRGFSIRYYEDQIRDCRELGLSQDQMVAIFGGNARRLLGMA